MRLFEIINGMRAKKTIVEIKVVYNDGSYHRYIKDGTGTENFSSYIGLVQNE